ncbi:hypothetical protein NON20_14475 [Synechocystis sp. B12]|nr:hypothetical protein NON20_14475 [Synechocystis sp. B12]
MNPGNFVINKYVLEPPLTFLAIAFVRLGQLTLQNSCEKLSQPG